MMMIIVVIVITIIRLMMFSLCVLELKMCGTEERSLDS